MNHLMKPQHKKVIIKTTRLSEITFDIGKDCNPKTARIIKI